MKRLIANTIMLAGGLTASSHLLALGLGELTLQSALNQPLQAEIELVDSKGLTEWEIKPTLASQADFERAGVDRLYFLTRINFKVDNNRIVLSSREPVNEPFLNFLVELNWPSGRVLREYTVLLDPPVFDEQNYRPLVTTPAGQTEVTGTVVTTTAAAATNNRWSEPAQPGTYKVQPDDTLWEIALQTRPSTAVSAQQMMLAIQQQNPEAFIGGNINRLKSHHVLDIPDAEMVKAVSMGQAVAEVARQNRALKAGAAQVDATGRAAQPVDGRAAKEGGEVRLLSDSSEDAASAGAGGEVAQGQGTGRQQALENDLAIALETVDKSRRENDELRTRLEALEEQINTLQRLITLKDDQLASMQTGSAVAEESAPALAAEEAVSPVGTEDVPAAETAGEEKAAVDFNYAAEKEAATEAPVAEEAAESAEDKARRERIAAIIAEQQKQQMPQPSLLDEMLANPAIPAGAGAVLLLIGLLIARALKKRKAAAAQDEQADDLEILTDLDNVDTSGLDEFDFDDDDLRSPVSPKPADLDSVDLDAADDGEPFETVAQTEDAISESDIYIAYGKFEQAVDLLQDAIGKEPSRTDLRLKLLEVYAEMDDAGNFATAESELASLGDRDASEEARLMRQRLSSPQDPSAAVAGAAALSLDDEIPELDDGLSDDFADGLDFGEALDLSSSSADVVEISEAAPAAEAEVPVLDLDNSLDFDLGEPDLDMDDEPVAEAEPAAPVAADDGLDFDMGDFDIASENEPETVVADEPVVAAGDDLLDFDLDSLAAEESEPEAAPAVAVADDDDSALDFDLDALAADESEEAAPEVVLADAEDSLDFDLDGAADADLADLDALSFDEPVAAEETADDAESLDSLESLLDGDDSGSSELPDLSFDMDDDTGFAAAGDDDLKALEMELGATADDAETVTDESESALDADLAALDDLSALDEADMDFELGDVAEAAPAPVAEPSDAASEGDIDLDELAAADDEFDFLAGTDECATKLDLARAYIDMEDFDGARELLQEVVQEGSDQQKTDARELMNNLS